MPAEEIGRSASGHAAIVSGGHQRLPSFIAENVEPIVCEWEAFARTLTPSSTGMTSLALRDHIHEILQFILSDILSDQTLREETLKSQGKKARSPDETAAETHAGLRLAGGFNIGQMTSEYRALRASVIKLWKRHNTSADERDLADLTRFNESVDQILTESVSFYAEEVFKSKDLFVAILGHDLRNPAQSVLLSAELMLRMGSLNDKQTALSKIIFDSADRINLLINTLLDVTRARFGGGLSIVRVPMNMGFVGRQIVEEIRAGHPDRTIRLNVSESLDGEWDKTRVGQALSNLLGNAIQYGFKDSPVDVTIEDDGEAVAIKVHNIGLPIPEEKMGAIFDPLTRVTQDGAGKAGSVNLGLGLFITKEVLSAHGGTIEVISSEKEGTIFTARFPRINTATLPVRSLGMRRSTVPARVSQTRSR